jgi:hypothetical protein
MDCAGRRLSLTQFRKHQRQKTIFFSYFPYEDVDSERKSFNLAKLGRLFAHRRRFSPLLFFRPLLARNKDCASCAALVSTLGGVCLKIRLQIHSTSVSRWMHIANIIQGFFPFVLRVALIRFVQQCAQSHVVIETQWQWTIFYHFLIINILRFVKDVKFLLEFFKGLISTENDIFWIFFLEDDHLNIRLIRYNIIIHL